MLSTFSLFRVIHTDIHKNSFNFPLGMTNIELVAGQLSLLETSLQGQRRKMDHFKIHPGKQKISPLTWFSRILDFGDFNHNPRILVALSFAYRSPGFPKKLSSLNLILFFFHTSDIERLFMGFLIWFINLN